MQVNKKSVQMNARRVCDAIARIGYNPSSAIMDIVDNSVAAGATKVTIKICLKKFKKTN